MIILTYNGRREESSEMTSIFTYQSSKYSGITAKKKRKKKVILGKLPPQEMEEAEFSNS